MVQAKNPQKISEYIPEDFVKIVMECYDPNKVAGNQYTSARDIYN